MKNDLIFEQVAKIPAIHKPKCKSPQYKSRKAYKAAYYLENKERIIKKQRIWDELNREYKREYCKKYHEKKLKKSIGNCMA